MGDIDGNDLVAACLVADLRLERFISSLLARPLGWWHGEHASQALSPDSVKAVGLD